MSFFGSNTPPAIKLPAQGQRFGGVIVELLPERQASKFQTPAERAAKAPRVPDTWPNGDPKMQQPIVLQLQPGAFQKTGPQDNGRRTLYVTKGDPRYKAIRNHYLETGQQPEIGLYLEMEFVGTEPGQGSNPKHIYVVTQLGEPEGGGGFFGDDTDPDDGGELVGAGAAPASQLPAKRPTRRAAAAPPSGNSPM